MCNAEASICAVLSFLLLFPIIIGCVGLFVFIPNSQKGHEDTLKNIDAFGSFVSSSTTLGTCVLNSKPANASCESTQQCTKWYRAPKCPNCHQSDSCLEYAPSKQCSCLVSVTGSEDFASSAEVVLPETRDLHRDARAWCAEVLQSPWPGIVTRREVPDRRWSCNVTSESIWSNAFAFENSLQMTCPIALTPDVPLDCIKTPAGQVWLGSKEAYHAASARSQSQSDSDLTTNLVIGIAMVVVSLACASGIFYFMAREVFGMSCELPGVCVSGFDAVTSFLTSRNHGDDAGVVVGHVVGTATGSSQMEQARCQYCGGSGERGLLGPTGFGFFVSQCGHCAGSGAEAVVVGVPLEGKTQA